MLFPWSRRSERRVEEWAVTLVKQRNGWRMSCDVGKATEGLESELWYWWRDGKVGEWAELEVIVIAELILQPFSHFTYVTIHSPTLPSLYLRRSSFSNPSVASPTSQFILQPFFRFSYVTSSSLCSFSNLSVTSPTSQLILQPFIRFTYATAHSPTLPLLHLRHSSFSNPSFASPTSQALRLIHLASRPWFQIFISLFAINF